LRPGFTLMRLIGIQSCREVRVDDGIDIVGEVDTIWRQRAGDVLELTRRDIRRDRLEHRNVVVARPYPRHVGGPLEIVERDVEAQRRELRGDVFGSLSKLSG